MVKKISKNKSLIKVKEFKDNFKDIKWIPKMSVEENTIDSQHQKLVATVNNLRKSVNPGAEIAICRDSLHFLEIYVKEHFSYEERYMDRIGFPGRKKYKNTHDKFVAYFLNFKKEFNKGLYSKDVSAEVLPDKIREMIADLRKYLANWLIDHMMGDDQEYHKYAIKKNLIGVFENKKNSKNNVSSVVANIKREIIGGQRKLLSGIPDLNSKSKSKKNIYTDISGFDDLLDVGIPIGSSIIIAGGAGSGKTIFCLQLLANKAIEGKKCLYLTLEERDDRLLSHMEDFGWNPRKLIKEKKLKIERINPFDITRNVEAMLAKQKGELLIDVEPVLLPKEYSKPDFIVVDSLTAIASAFAGKEDSYRIYIEQLFRFLEKTGATSFLITETEQVPKIFSQTGVEEFLADGVIVFYSIKHSNMRENAIEVLKLRGASHQKRIVAMQVTSKGIVVYPEQEVFSEL